MAQDCEQNRHSQPHSKRYILHQEHPAIQEV